MALVSRDSSLGLKVSFPIRKSVGSSPTVVNFLPFEGSLGFPCEQKRPRNRQKPSQKRGQDQVPRRSLENFGCRDLRAGLNRDAGMLRVRMRRRPSLVHR